MNVKTCFFNKHFQGVVMKRKHICKKKKKKENQQQAFREKSKSSEKRDSHTKSQPLKSKPLRVDFRIYQL